MTDRRFTFGLTTTSHNDRIAGAEVGHRAILSFEFLSDLAPSLPVTDALACYDDVLRQTTVKQDIAQAMKPLWLHGYLSSDPRIANAALAPLRQQDIPFKWPLFEQWRTKFIGAKRFPETWSHFQDRACDRRLGLRDEMVAMLCAHIDGCIYNRHRAGQLRAVADRRRCRADTDDSAARPFLLDLYAKLDVFDLATVPPYFPGDRSSMQLERPAPTL